jgi:hypothetical protein
MVRDAGARRPLAAASGGPASWPLVGIVGMETRALIILPKRLLFDRKVIAAA